MGRLNRVPGSGAEPVPGRWGYRRRAVRESGAVLVLVVAFLPVLAAVMGLMVETGRLFVLSRGVQAAADMGALAGAQEVDLDRLAEGERFLDEERAKVQAERITRQNLRALGGVLGEAGRVQVYVINVADGPAAHPRTRRPIRDPTVSVWVEVTVPVHLVGSASAVQLSAHADASVVEKRSARR